ncbi:MAG TPA: hypothetical protein VER08_00510 [Pyrinomonadaceae bacterium]|nr:hypothetical protein [Pyrinomonadaceae bacterium]
MSFAKSWKLLPAACVLAAAAVGAACGEATVTNSTNTTAPNVNASPATAGGAGTTTADPSARLEVREPDTYRATYVLAGQTTGAQAAAASTSIEVARRGADRRYSLDTKVPGVGKITFLDRADKRYLILEGRKQYLELTPETTGFNVPRSMTPGMMIEQLQNQQGVTKVGEEQVSGRTAVKYRVAGTVRTGTQAGDTKAESFVFVDKETGLPLRVESAAAAQGNVQGVSGGTATMELRDISTTVDPTTFELPADYRKVTQEEMQQMGRLLVGFLQAFSGAAASQGGAAPAPGTSPATAASPASSPANP